MASLSSPSQTQSLSLNWCQPHSTLETFVYYASSLFQTIPWTPQPLLPSSQQRSSTKTSHSLSLWASYSAIRTWGSYAKAQRSRTCIGRLLFAQAPIESCANSSHLKEAYGRWLVSADRCFVWSKAQSQGNRCCDLAEVHSIGVGKKWNNCNRRGLGIQRVGLRALQIGKRRLGSLSVREKRS